MGVHENLIRRLKGMALIDGRKAISSAQITDICRSMGLVRTDRIKEHILTLEAQGLMTLNRSSSFFEFDIEKLKNYEFKR